MGCADASLLSVSGAVSEIASGGMKSVAHKSPQSSHVGTDADIEPDPVMLLTQSVQGEHVLSSDDVGDERARLPNGLGGETAV